MMSSISLFFDNETGNTVPAGGTLRGTVECNFNTEKSVNVIQLKIKGKGHVQWTESEQEYNKEREEYEYKDVEYSGDEGYLNITYDLYKAGNTTTIPAGKHTYRFSVDLPSNLPSSFEGSYGYIRYYVYAVAHRTWKTNFETKKLLKILSNVNLNLLPKVREPVAISLDETMCSCCCTRPEILTFNMSLPATGFVPGQAVSIGCHIKNMTNVNVEQVKFKIIKKLEFITRNPSRKIKKEKYVLSQSEEGKIGAHGEKSWTTTLRIPTNHQYPDLIFCSIMDLSYRLEVKAVLPFPNSDIQNRIPLTIGAIPLSGVTTVFAGNAPGEEIRNTSVEATAVPTNTISVENNTDINVATDVATTFKSVTGLNTEVTASKSQVTVSKAQVTVSKAQVIVSNAQATAPPEEVTSM